MRLFLLATISLFITAVASAQDNIPYAEKARQIQNDVWGTKVPEFAATKVPANLANEGAVVLARSFSLQRTSKPRVKWMLVSAGITTKTVKFTTYHERVAINDKVALENFSTLEYQKKMDKTTSLLFSKMINVSNTYIGAKIIKPDGKEVIVNTGEEVLLKNEEKDQKGKLAIPGLQVGDILDYYISSTDIAESGDGNSYRDNDNIFVMVDEYPVVYYSIDLQYNKKIHVRYITANGAPSFTVDNNDADDQLLSVKARNLPKYESELWTSPYRQYPYIEVGSSYSGRGSNGFLENGDASMFQRDEALFKASFGEYPGFDEPERNLKSFFDSRKNLKNAPVDSLVKVLYDEWKFDVFCNYFGKELESIDDMNYRTAQSLHAATVMSMMLTDLGVDHNVLLVASRNSNSLDNVYNPEDMDAMIMVNTATPIYLAFDDVTTHFNEIPARFQGEKAVELFPRRHYGQHYSFDEGQTNLPVVAADKNSVEENLQVSMLPSNTQKLKVTRLVKEQGELKHADQKLLLPVADVDEGIRSLVKGDDRAKRLKSRTETKKMVDDYTFSFNKQKSNIVKNFTAEIKNQYDQEPEQVQDTKIITPSLENNEPFFQYSSSFVLNNLVKKAGNNYIIDAGKLTGSFYKLDDKERKRTTDIYMPCARSFKYTIAITIPQGYSVSGMDEMNVKKTNVTGSFTSSAVLKDNVLTITITRAYLNNFEKVANWPKLMEIMDAAANFNTQKILLEKKG